MWMSLYIINGALLVGVGALTVYLWQNSIITIGEVAMVLPLTIQLKNMATWMMEIANGVFEMWAQLKRVWRPFQISHSHR